MNPPRTFFLVSSGIATPITFFFSPYGVWSFVLVALMLFITLVISSMFIVTNTIYFTLGLLLVTCSAVFQLVANSIVQPLTGVILLLVYLGAIIILIGYICAVCPNFITVKLLSFSINAFYLVIFALFLLPPRTFFLVSSGIATPITFFFSPYGVWSFALVAFMLFITLLIVTSQYFSPNGPFRSVF